MNPKLLKSIVGHGAGGLAGSAFYDQLQGHSVPTSFDDISKQRALNFLFNAALVGSGAKFLGAGMKGKNPTQGLAGSGMMFSPPFKDLALAATKPVMELPGLFDSLRNNRSNKLLTGGVLGLGALGLGAYGLSKYKEHTDDDAGTIEVTLPTRDPNDKETVVRLPLSQANLSKSMRTNIERDMRRRLRSGGTERTRKRDPESGSLIPMHEYQAKYAAMTPSPGAMSQPSTSGAGTTPLGNAPPPPPPGTAMHGATLPASVRQPEIQEGGAIPVPDPAAEAAAAQAEEANTAATEANNAATEAASENQMLKVENEKLRAKEEVARAKQEAAAAKSEAASAGNELPPSLKEQAARAMNAVNGIKAAGTAGALLHLLSDRYSVKRARIRESAMLKSAGVVPPSLGKSPAVQGANAVKPAPGAGRRDNTLTLPKPDNSMATPAVTQATDVGAAPTPTTTPTTEPAALPAQPVAYRPTYTPGQAPGATFEESTPYAKADYARLTPEQKEEQRVAMKSYYDSKMEDENWFDRAIQNPTDGNVFNSGEENSMVGNLVRGTGNFLVSPLRGYANAAKNWGAADSAYQRGAEIRDAYDGYTGIGADMKNLLFNDQEKREAYQAYKDKMEAAGAQSWMESKWNKAKARGQGGIVAGGTAGSLLLPMLGTAGVVGAVGKTLASGGAGLISDWAGGADKPNNDQEAYEYFKGLEGRDDTVRPTSLLRAGNGGYSNYALNNMNNNGYNNAYRGASDFGNPMLNFAVNTGLPMLTGYFGQNPSWNNTMSGMYSAPSAPDPRTQMMNQLSQGLSLAQQRGVPNFQQNLWPV